ncbi:14848_t:CDS:1, partial [Entrophospora sp. SA101]
LLKPCSVNLLNKTSFASQFKTLHGPKFLGIDFIKDLDCGKAG